MALDWLPGTSRPPTTYSPQVPLDWYSDHLSQVTGDLSVLVWMVSSVCTMMPWPSVLIYLLFYQFNYINPLTFSPLRLYVLGSHLTIYIHKYISGRWLHRHSFASYERHEVVCSHNVWPSWVLSLLKKEHCNFFPLVRVKLHQRSIATLGCCKHQDWEIKLDW